MLFNSFQFLLFFILVTPLYYLTGFKWRWLLLLLASCYFYASFIPAYLLILFTIIIIDYTAGRFIENAGGNRRKFFLIVSIVANLGVLGIFKYYNFFIDNVNELLALLGIRTTPFPLWHLALPIGLSFHTFQAMSYTIEVYRGNQKAEKHPGIYALYVMFYPQLVAGPIERPQQLLPQFYERRRPDYEGISEGLKTMLWGFFMKVVVADRLAIYVDFAYTHPELHSRLALLMAAFFYSFQIYCDFAGYSLIALGSARTMGFQLMKNFNAPFLARSVTEFWRRWHISLYSWFNDYLFIPIVINRRTWGQWSVIYGLFITFFLSGLWHGAAWTFVIMGLLQAFAISIEFLTAKWKTRLENKIVRVIAALARRLITFSFISFAFIFFRSPNLHEAFSVIHRITSPGTPWKIAAEFESRTLLLYSFFGIACVIMSDVKKEFFSNTRLLLYDKKAGVRLTSCIALVIIILLLGVFDGGQFIYFQF
jgi:alginate O-acetyltransferase complex protein AlgI